MKAKLIREESAFGSLRITMTAFLENARIWRMCELRFRQTLVLGMSPCRSRSRWTSPPCWQTSPHLLAYQKETTIAKKLHALVALERSSSRMSGHLYLYQ